MSEWFTQYLPPDYSAHGPALDRLTVNVHWLMLILFVGWGLVFTFMLFRFRKGKHPKAVYHGTKSHISTYAEFGILVVEIVLLVVFSIPLWARWTSPPGPNENPLEVRVVAEQFAWNIHYPGPDHLFGKTDVKHVSSANPLGIDVTDPNAKDDVVTLNQFHMQVNRPVYIHLTSKDVIHSFGLPYMRVKQDAVPGMQIPVHFTPIKTSGTETWEIACAQLCGLGHYRMKGQYQVHTKAEFDQWMASQAPFVSTVSE
jgi:cytochrome c oxidase subunit 2